MYNLQLNKHADVMRHLIYLFHFTRSDSVDREMISSRRFTSPCFLAVLPRLHLLQVFLNSIHTSFPGSSNRYFYNRHCTHPLPHCDRLPQPITIACSLWDLQCSVHYCFFIYFVSEHKQYSLLDLPLLVLRQIWLPFNICRVSLLSLIFSSPLSE